MLFNIIISSNQPKINDLNPTNIRERDVIFGLLKLYDILINKYKDKYKIVNIEKDVKNQVFDEVLNSKNLNEDQVRIIKESGLIDANIDMDKVKLTKQEEKPFVKKETLKQKLKQNYFI